MHFTDRPSRTGIQSLGMDYGTKRLRMGEHTETVSFDPGCEFFMTELLTFLYGKSGVYLAKEGSVSSGGYAAAGRAWRRSRLAPTVCMALAEIVNLPGQFVSNNPYYVVQHTHWIMWYAFFCYEFEEW